MLRLAALLLAVAVGIAGASSIGRAEAPKTTKKTPPKTLAPKAGSAKGGATLGFGATADGELGPDDETMPGDETFYETWRIDGVEGDLVVVRAMSEGFAPYLMLFTGGTLPTPIADSSSGAIAIELPQDGPYLVVVNGMEAGAAGAYKVRVDRLPPL
jgi:hypothetical protein